MKLERALQRYWLIALGTIVGVVMMAAAHAAEGAAQASTEDASYAPISGGPFRSILPSGGRERVELRVEPFRCSARR